jgi:protein O-GlcNAc transferase
LMYGWNVAEATDSFREAVRISPGNAMDHSNLLFGLSKSAAINAHTLYLEHLKFGEYFEAPYRGIHQQYANTPDKERCLRIGVVSGDLRNHAVANFLEPMLPVLAGATQISLYAYSNFIVEDQVAQRLREHFAYWQVMTNMTDDEMAEKIRDDRIDILIDLSGHTAKNRLLVFARKPAPIQASWIGYPGTTGLSAMDYYLADKLLFPQERFAWQFTEKLVYLPTTVPFLPSQESPEVGPLPALRNGYITFGSFNQPNKISREVIALWARLLRAIPDSRMLIAALPREINKEPLLQWFSDEGVDLGRLQLSQRCDMKAYLTLHQQVDMCLDTFPYSGGTTTNHALWMGVPTLTVAGETPPSWQSARLMHAVGLGEFVAGDADDFVLRGASIARDSRALARIRAGLRTRFEASPIGKPEVVADALLRAFRIMWHRWCEDLPPESFEVNGDG